jgi:hypothetical protein
MAHTTAPPASALGFGGVAGLSNEDLAAQLDDLFTMRARIDSRIVELLGEVGPAAARAAGHPKR